jgi:RNA polymerase sigma factor (sigma-70 family)
MSDPELTAAMRGGRAEEAFTQLYRQLPDVIKLVRGHGGSRSDARDLFQDALVALYEKAAGPAFQINGTLAAYLYGICRNLWLAELRAKGKAEQLKRMLANTPADATAIDVPKEPMMQLAERAFQVLGGKCRELLSRFYLHNGSFADIAAEFGFTSEGAAKTRKYKCLEQARAKYRMLLSNTQSI